MKHLLDQILHWAYCLDLFDAVLLVVFLSLLFLLANVCLGEKRWWKPVLAVLLLAVMTVILYVTVRNRTYGHTAEPALVPFHSYREVMRGGSRELLRSNFMNALLFYPAGLLGASLLPKKRHSAWRRILSVTVVFTALSAGIEYMQYIGSLGSVEIDDVIHNAFGALLGAAVGCLKSPKIL